jgi:hypothetical protein
MMNFPTTVLIITKHVPLDVPSTRVQVAKLGFKHSLYKIQSESIQE